MIDQEEHERIQDSSGHGPRLSPRHRHLFSSLNVVDPPGLSRFGMLVVYEQVLAIRGNHRPELLSSCQRMTSL